MKVNLPLPRAFSRGLIFPAFCLAIGLAYPALSQTQDPYLVSATFYVSVDDWADLWLNGIPIVDSQPHTPMDADTKIIRAKPNSLCYFTRENLLAIEITKTTIKNKFAQDPSVGFAYILKLKLSDGREILLTSNEPDQHRALYLPDQGITEPFRWHDRLFNDASWVSSFSTSFHLPSCAVVKDPESGALASFLSARSASPQSLHPGERHLFRRYFSLPILPNPLCLTPTQVPVREKPVFIQPEGPRHSQMPHPPRPTPTFTSTPIPIWTFSPTITPNFSLLTPHLLPTGIPTSIPRIEPARIPVALPSPTFTPGPVYYATPTPRYHHEPLARPIFTASTPTQVVWKPTLAPPKKTSRIQSIYPTWVVQVFTPTPTVFWEYRPPSATPTAIPVIPRIPTATATPPLAESQAQTLEVDAPPANLYVSFSDGPGVYRLVVYDSQGHLVRSIYEKRAVTQSDDWALWDGKDNSGRDAPPGYYRVVFTQNGIHLKDVILHLGAGNP
jgi:hypothetical protein